MLSLAFLVDLTTAAVRIGTPLGLAAVGEVYSERAGVLNIGLEAMMLTGAFTAVLGSYYSHSVWVGLLAGIAGGLLIALIHGILSITLQADQIVSGISLNILAYGLTSYLSRAVWGSGSIKEVASLSPIKIPGLGSLPVIGPILFQHHLLVYVGFVLVPVLYFVLRRTTWGLAIQAAGENPTAAEAAGLRVVAVRYICLLLAGAIGGLAGASLSIGGLKFFTDNMTGGRGYIALAAVIFGRWHPVGAFLAAMFFGLADALQLRFQLLNLGIPSPVMLMLPYVLTLLVLAILKGGALQPSMLGQPYIKGQR